MTAPPPAAEIPPTLPSAQSRRGFSGGRTTSFGATQGDALPLLVTQTPLAIAAAAAYFVLFFHVYNDVAFDSFEPSVSPDGLKLSLFVANAVYLLFTAVGLSATITAVHGVLAGRPPGLAAALDPSFTRMGGLLALGIIFQLLFALTVAGVFLLLYVVFRFGLTFHVYMLENLGSGRR